MGLGVGVDVGLGLDLRVVRALLDPTPSEVHLSLLQRRSTIARDERDSDFLNTLTRSVGTATLADT